MRCYKYLNLKILIGPVYIKLLITLYLDFIKLGVQKIRFLINKKYIIPTLIIFWIEILIAIFFYNNIIRSFVGDVLVIILIYFFLSIFIKTKKIYIWLFCLLFAYIIEFLQFINILKLLDLPRCKILTIILWNTFDRKDLLAYTIWFWIIFFFEKILK